MFNRLTITLGLLLCAPLARAESTFTDVLAPAFAKHCVKCHGREGKVKGKVDLLQLKAATDLTMRPELIQDLIAVIDAGDMPPETESALPDDVRQGLVAELKKLLLSSVGETKEFARTPIRRMNRFQYNNAVQDLFELKVDVFGLPERMLREHGVYFRPETGKMPDAMKVGSRPLGKSQLIGNRLGGDVAPFPQDLRAEHGFDNRADHLTLSPLLLESFFRLSQSILESHDVNPKTVGIWDEFFASPPESSELEKVVAKRLREFLSRAFRGPVKERQLKRYVRQVIARIRGGASFEESMKGAAAAAMCSPRFLYLFDGAIRPRHIPTALPPQPFVPLMKTRNRCATYANVQTQDSKLPFKGNSAH